MKIFFIALKEFDTLIDRMTLALDSANNLGQFTTSVKILFQMNEELPDDLQLYFEDISSKEYFFLILFSALCKYLMA